MQGAYTTPLGFSILTSDMVRLVCTSPAPVKNKGKHTWCCHPCVHLDTANPQRCMFHSGIIYLIRHRVGWDLYTPVIKAVSGKEHIFGDVLVRA